MTNKTSPAFFASCILHGMLAFVFVVFLRPPVERIRSALPEVPILTLVPAPQTAAVSEAASKSKPVAAKPIPPPEPVNLTPAVEPVTEPVAPETVSPVATVNAPASETEVASATPASIPVPIDPVYPASRIKGGLVPLACSEPPYPLIAQDRGIEGSVDVQFVVDKSGGVEDVWVAQSSYKAFSDAVIKTVRKFRFKPPVVDGKIARVKANQHFEFKLE
jgi:periplasmic protein TonB